MRNAAVRNYVTAFFKFVRDAFSSIFGDDIYGSFAAIAVKCTISVNVLALYRRE